MGKLSSYTRGYSSTVFGVSCLCFLGLALTNCGDNKLGFTDGGASSAVKDNDSVKREIGEADENSRTKATSDATAVTPTSSAQTPISTTPIDPSSSNSNSTPTPGSGIEVAVTPTSIGENSSQKPNAEVTTTPNPVIIGSNIITPVPTAAPVVTAIPTITIPSSTPEPTSTPIIVPTIPVATPTAVPTEAPTPVPTTLPTAIPTQSPISEPLPICSQGDTSNVTGYVFNLKNGQYYNDYNNYLTSLGTITNGAQYVTNNYFYQDSELNTSTYLSRVCKDNLFIPEVLYTQGFPGVNGNVFEWFGIRFYSKLVVTEANYYFFKLDNDDGAIAYIYSDSFKEKSSNLLTTNDDKQKQQSIGFYTNKVDGVKNGQLTSNTASTIVMLNNMGVHPMTDSVQSGNLGNNVQGSVWLDPGTYHIMLDYAQARPYHIGIKLLWNKGGTTITQNNGAQVINYVAIPNSAFQPETDAVNLSFIP